MIIYEVNVRVEASIADDYRKWLGPHAEEVASLGGFKAFQIYDINSGGTSEPGFKEWVLHFRAHDLKSVQNYIEMYAPKLRQGALDKFGSRFSATRRILVNQG